MIWCRSKRLRFLRSVCVTSGAFRKRMIGGRILYAMIRTRLLSLSITNCWIQIMARWYVSKSSTVECKHKTHTFSALFLTRAGRCFSIDDSCAMHPKACFCSSGCAASLHDSMSHFRCSSLIDLSHKIPNAACLIIGQFEDDCRCSSCRLGPDCEC